MFEEGTLGKPRILFVDDQPQMLAAIIRLLRGSCEVLVASSVQDALASLGREAVDAVVVDRYLGGEDGAAVLAHARIVQPGAVRVLTSAFEPEELDVGTVQVWVRKDEISGELMRLLERGPGKRGLV